MTLSAADHQRVKRETMATRTAGRRYGRRRWRRAWDFVQASGARVAVQERPEGLFYFVRVPGFHEQSARCLPDAVDQARATVAHFLASGATHGPTGRRLDRLREALGGE
jgi:hypothetical protein